MQLSHQILKIICYLLFSQLAWSVEIDKSVEDKLTKQYQEIEALFERAGGQNVPTQTSPSLDISLKESGHAPGSYTIRGNLLVKIRSETFEFQSLLNRSLFSKINETIDPDLVPSLRIGEALVKGEKMLNHFGLSSQRELLVEKISFNQSYPSCWEVRWIPTYQGYPVDNFVEPYAETAFVVFHESLGLVLVGEEIYSPAPPSFELNIEREQAIANASKYVPLVQRSPFYRQAREDGFVAVSVKSCVLKIAAPNWLLDPDRAVWIREKPPEETRLCWVVRFTTMDSKAAERNLKNKDGKQMKLIPPEILIYLDAATGDCIGANFT